MKRLESKKEFKDKELFRKWALDEENYWARPYSKNKNFASQYPRWEKQQGPQPIQSGGDGTVFQPTKSDGGCGPCHGAHGASKHAMTWDDSHEGPGDDAPFDDHHDYYHDPPPPEEQHRASLAAVHIEEEETTPRQSKQQSDEVSGCQGHAFLFRGLSLGHRAFPLNGPLMLASLATRATRPPSLPFEWAFD